MTLKPAIIRIAVASSVLLLIIAFVLDVFRLFGVSPSPIVWVIKYSVSVLTGLIVFFAGARAINTHDHSLLVGAFIVTLIADFILVILQRLVPVSLRSIIIPAGICCFMIVQVILILRHSQSLHFSIKNIPGRLPFFTLRNMIVGVCIAFPVIGALLWIMPDLLRVGLVVPVLVYGMLIMFSAWVAVCARWVPFTSPVNGILIAVGMLCFLVCDMLVGINTVKPSVAIDMCIYPFYGPALILLALSGYHPAFLKEFFNLHSTT